MKRLLIPVVLILQACATQPVPEPEPAPPPVAAPVAAPVPEAAAPTPPPVEPKPPAKPVIATPKPFDVRPVPVEPPTIVGIDRAHEPTDLWSRIRKGFAIQDLNGPLVKRHTTQYAARPEYLYRILERSKRYLFHIVEEVEKRGMPTELALLPMVESAFNPMAYSRAHASGLWQFIPGTGRRFELEQSTWYDARRDIVDSTNAALDYLTKLYEMHGDWHLALASYNWGENAVRRAVARNKAARKKTDYSSLRMPKETRNYIPKLQALENIIADPTKYGVDLDAIPNQPYFTVITETPDIDVHLAAKLAEMPVEEFIALNPGFSRPFIRASETRRIILPTEKVVIFYDNLDKLDESALVSWQVYHPKPGEKIDAIAKRFHIGINELKRVNGIPAHSSRLPKEMVVPKNGEARETIADLPLMYAPPIPQARGVHVVRRGDTLSSIAAKYRVSVAGIKRANTNLGRYLQVGQRIRIP